jgi:large subunit ribosomal protein L18
MRVRKKLRGTSVKPRMSVVKTNLHLHVQLIDDEAGHTLGSIGTYAKKFRGTEFGRKNKQAARKLGEEIAEIAKSHHVKEVVFDRGPHKYHGVLAELANAAREAGLQF